MAKAKQWPNGLGWDVGRAEVRDLHICYRVFVPIAPEVTPAILKHGRRSVRSRYKVADVGRESDPVAAVAVCRRSGLIRYEDEAINGAVPLLPCNQ